MDSGRFRRFSVLLVSLVILSMVVVGCVPAPTPAATRSGEDTATPVSEKTNAAPTQAAPASAPTQTSPAPTKTTQASAPANAQPSATPESVSLPATDGLSSYRIHEEWRTDGIDGPVEDWFDVEFVADPVAFHQLSEGMESVFIGTTYWTRFEDMPWHKVDISLEEFEEMSKEMGELESPVDVEEHAELDDSVEWLMGQPQLNIVEGSLTEAGTEVINDVNCTRYTIDSTYAYKVSYQVPISASAEITEQLQGEIWLADQAGWPAFLVRAALLKTSTTQVEGGMSTTETQWLQEDVFDINSPDIVIVAPE